MQHSPSLDWTLSEIATLTQTTLKGDPEHRITGVADLRQASSLDASFFADERYKQAAETTHAGVLFMRPDSGLRRTGATLLSDNPKEAFARLCQHLHAAKTPPLKACFIHPTAVIDPSAQIGLNVIIGPHVVIEEGVVIGDASQIGAGCYLGHSVQLGTQCHLFPRVTLLERTLIGHHVVLQPGVVIGSLGFGYHTDARGTHTFIPHFGYVIIEDDVEIGANSTIDRGQLGATIIGKGTKFDNQVQIGHNGEIGENNLFVAQVGFGGSSKTGKNVVLAGKVGVNDHVELGHQVVVSAFSAVSKNLNEAGPYGGIPAEPFSSYKRNLVLNRNIQAHVKKLNTLTERIEMLEKRLSS